MFQVIVNSLRSKWLILISDDDGVHRYIKKNVNETLNIFEAKCYVIEFLNVLIC